jgi:branched-subunit amino acid transport protein
MSIWLLIVGAGLATFGARALFSVLPGSWHLPASVQDLLEYVPAAVFAALAAPGLLEGGGASTPVPSSSKVLASVIGAYVAWHTKNLLLVLVVGMVVYWLDMWVS